MLSLGAFRHEGLEDLVYAISMSARLLPTFPGPLGEQLQIRPRRVLIRLQPLG